MDTTSSCKESKHNYFGLYEILLLEILKQCFFGAASIHMICVLATFICYFAECPNLKFRSIEYVDVTPCKTGIDVDVTVICPELTVVKDLPIKQPPETDGLGREPREEAWMIRRRMYNGDSFDRLARASSLIVWHHSLVKYIEANEEPFISEPLESLCVQVVTCTLFFHV